MAIRKISDLTAATNAADDDLVQIVDVSDTTYGATGTNKKIEVADLFAGRGGGTVTSVATGTGLTGGPITSSGTVSLANTAVTPGSYTSADITVDAQGRITSAANGSGGADKWRIFGSSNVSGTSERYVGIRGNSVDTSAPNLYTQAMLPDDCEVVSISCRIGATANATWRAYASGTKIYDSGLQAFTANVAQTFTPSGATASQGQMFAISVEASATPADVYCVVTIQAT